MEPVARGVDVDMVMRSVTLTPSLCVGMSCVIGEAVVFVALTESEIPEYRGDRRFRTDHDLIALHYIRLYYTLQSPSGGLSKT